jgi:hypothetical protein
LSALTADQVIELLTDYTRETGASLDILLVGALALQAYGYQNRLTRDLDAEVVVLNRRGQSLSVDVPPVANLHERNHARVIVNGIDNAIVPLANAIVIMPGDLFAARRSRIATQSTQTVCNAAQIGLGYCTQLPFCRLLDDETIRVRHA